MMLSDKSGVQAQISCMEKVYYKTKKKTERVPKYQSESERKYCFVRLTIRHTDKKKLQHTQKNVTMHKATVD